MDLLDVLTVAKQSALLRAMKSETDQALKTKAVKLAEQFCNGQYLDVIATFGGTALSNSVLLEALAQSTAETNVYNHVHELVLAYINHSDHATTVEHTFECLLLAISYLELYCQANYTGPELPPALLDVFNVNAAGCVSELECDGTYAFRSIELPQTLLLARIILSTLAEPQAAGWKQGITLDIKGNVSRKLMASAEPAATLATERQALKSITWWSARAAVIHLRLLQKQSYDDVPTLWNEVTTKFSAVLSTFSSLPVGANLLTATAPASEETRDPDTPHSPAEEAVTESSKPAAIPVADLGKLPDIVLRLSDLTSSITTASAPEFSTELAACWESLRKQLGAQAWLEWGLCCLHFCYSDKGKKSFAFAKEVAGLHTEMTAALGRRTKHQHSDYAQLYLFAKSGLVGTAVVSAADNDVAAADASCADASLMAAESKLQPQLVAHAMPEQPAEGGWEHSEWEMGRRLVRETTQGEEVAVREVLLDSVDGGAQENVVLEGGPRFAADLDKGSDLHPVDQAIILALCLDVSNSNPVDGLTNEEMLPYIERVLALATNWMIHSTSLLERSWLEFERRKTMDRAMLQIQALIDQHTTKLTLMQSTYQSVEDSAPVQDRMRYLYSIVYPAQYELKRDLAVRYLRCQVFVSALNYFRELEMWDEVVTCYQLMDKPHRAELVVREQLKHGETPYMLTSLADLTRKEEYYVQAWELSKGRYPRAMRTLGKICYDRGDYLNAIAHLDDALAVHPLVATAWYLKGLACMRIEKYDLAIDAFVRCVQQDMEIGEAWANIGAINMRLRAFPKAYEALTEALRHKRDNWRILENLMSVALALGKWRDVVRYMNNLLDLKHKSERPVHKDELRHLCFIVASQAQREARARAKALAKASADAAATDGAASVDPPTPVQATSAAAPLIPAPPPVPDSVLTTLQSLFSEDPEFDADDLDSVLEVAPLPDLVLSVEKLLTKISNAIRSDPDVWDVFAEFQHALGRFRLELECRTKQFRGLTNEDAWEKSSEKIDTVVSAGRLLARAHHFRDVKKSDFYSGRMLLQTALRRIENSAVAAECVPARESLTQLVNCFGGVYDSL